MSQDRSAQGAGSAASPGPGNLPAPPAASGLRAPREDAQMARTIAGMAPHSPRPVPGWARRFSAWTSTGGSLPGWAARYLILKLGGRSPNTVAARGRDLCRFIAWFAEHLGHLDIERWMVPHTRQHLSHLAERGLAPTSINRALWSLRHFAGWVATQPGGLFARWGHPVVDVREIKVDEAPCRKLTAGQLQALWEAATRRTVLPPGHPMQRPWRDAAILSVLATTGLRVSELVHLRRGQYDGQALCNVTRKGSAQSRRVLLTAAARRLLDTYLGGEWTGDGERFPAGTAPPGLPLFLSAKSPRPLDRVRVARIVARLAAQACAGDGSLTVHPHQLRHTFGSMYRAASGSDTETAAALGHASLRYVGRYTRRSQEERQSVVDTMFAALQDAGSGAPEGAATGPEGRTDELDKSCQNR